MGYKVLGGVLETGTIIALSWIEFHELDKEDDKLRGNAGQRSID